VSGFGVVEFGEERGEGRFAASGGAGGVESDVPGAVDDLLVPAQGESFAEQVPGFVVAAAVVRTQEAKLPEPNPPGSTTSPSPPTDRRPRAAEAQRGPTRACSYTSLKRPPRKTHRSAT
jgi:hypothetical protein